MLKENDLNLHETVKEVRIHLGLVQEWITAGHVFEHVVCVAGLPRDAELKEAEVYGSELRMRFTSKSWTEWHRDEVVEVIVPEHMKVREL